MQMTLLLLGGALALSASQLGRAVVAETPVELGRVAWERDFAAAKLRARAVEKPILLLFQEVPG